MYEPKKFGKVFTSKFAGTGPSFYEKRIYRATVYRPIILPVVLYGCETWSLTLKEERSMRMFENRVLMRVF
jgi:hypothetical protein